ncbi:MAG TPA: glycine oxidase ThiO [Terriglobia bacterium]|nr:glycine oxidase ThiO [Terriglobia bacterium]
MAESINPGKAPCTADVVVMGGGVIGCAVALRLAQQRLKVAVVDRAEPGSEASSAAAGMIAPQGEMVEFGPYFELCAVSRDLYAGFVEEVESLAGESVGYRREGTLLVAPDEAASRELEEIYRRQQSQGLPLERLTRAAVLERVPRLSSEIVSGVFLPGDHRVDNERLTPAVAQAASRLGVTLMTHTVVTRLNVTSGRLESIETRADSGSATSTLSAGRFVLAAGCWSSELVAPLGMHLPMQPCRGQMLEFESTEELPFAVRAGHHYLVPRAPRRILAGTTAEYAGFEKQVTGEGLRSILEGVMRFAPFMKQLRFQRAWAGLRPDTADHLPILGYGGIDGLIFATGHFRNGILLAPVTAQLIAELVVTGSTSRSIEAYRPTRFNLAAAPRTAKNFS